MRRLGQGALTVPLLIAALSYSMWNIGFFEASRYARAADNIATFIKELFPPNFGIVDTVSWAILETIQMALLGTFLGFSLALPAGMLGARNVFGGAIAATTRLILSFTRTVPALLWAVILVVTVGLGPLAGTLGLAIYTFGYLGKLYSEAIEGVDPEVLEALKGIGCSRLQLIRYAIVPESANQVLSQLLFIFEYNVRASTILGFVGAGGIGFYVLNYIQYFQYRRLSAAILMILLIVLAIDFISAKLRDRVLLAR